MASFSVQPEPGDIIEIFHVGYKDWAIYVGENSVIHLTSPSKFPRIGSSNILIFLSGRAQVTKEPLQRAALGCFYRVNNYLEQKCRPLPVDEIISSANKMIGEEKKYTVDCDDSKTFAGNLRYGWPRWELSPEDLIPGDMIEIFRGLYSHWAIYVGDGKVVHVSTHSGIGSCCAGSGSCNKSEYEGKATVKCEPLKVVAKNNMYKVNNYLDNKRRPRAVDDIVKMAKKKIGESVCYNVVTSNCEHFVTGLRYGFCRSQQVTDYVKSLFTLGASTVTSIVIVALR